MSWEKRVFWCLAFAFQLFFHSMIGQDQRIADSLKHIYTADTLKGEAKYELLANLAFNEINDLDKALEYSEELIVISRLNNNYPYLSQGYFQKGTKKARMGDLEEAITAYFESAKIAKRVNETVLEGSAYSTIADIYSISNNHKNSMLYYHKAITTLRKTSDSIALASSILNAGDELLSNKEYDSAIIYFKESGSIFEIVNYAIGNAYNLGNIGMAYAEKGQYRLAEKNINNAILILEEFEDYYPICEYLLSMADIYVANDDYSQALKYAQRSLVLSKKYGLDDQISDASLKLSEIHEIEGNILNSFQHYKTHIRYRDSLNNIESVQAIANLRTDFEVSQKQGEVNLLKEQRRNQRITVISISIALILILILAFGLFRRNKFITKTNDIIKKEKDRSDLLLLNILPEETAQELKTNSNVKAKKFDSVSVLFTDFEGFTRNSTRLSPEELVNSVDYYFSKFDDIMKRNGLEKIKTVGDAYMAAGGLPFPTEDHAEIMIKAAFEILEFVKSSKKDDPGNGSRFDIRVGINSGPVVAGVVGTSKFAYDIWGDTVNIASRMESNSETGKVNISEQTYDLVKDIYDCEYRGEIDVKNRGILKMYFVNGLKKEAT